MHFQALLRGLFSEVQVLQTRDPYTPTHNLSTLLTLKAP